MIDSPGSNTSLTKGVIELTALSAYIITINHLNCFCSSDNLDTNENNKIVNLGKLLVMTEDKTYLEVSVDICKFIIKLLCLKFIQKIIIHKS